MLETLPTGRYQGSLQKEIQAHGLLVTESTYARGADFPRHAHEAPFLYFVLAGTCVERFDRREEEVRANSLMFHGPGQSHSTTWPRAGRCLHVTLLSDRWSQALNDGTMQTPSQVRDESISIVARKMYKEFRLSDPFSPLAIEGLALQLLATCMRPKHSLVPDSRILARALEIVAERYPEDWSLTRYARELGCHPSYLARLFQRQLGMTLGACVRKRRIEEASRTLRGTDAPVGAIALQAGFFDQSHFTRTFRAETGMSPSSYRALHRESR